jgi:hypothetical protein
VSTVTVDVGFIQQIESALATDVCPSPDVVAPLAERDRNRWGLTPQEERALGDEIQRAMDGDWLELWEVHAIQRLRYGSVAVDRDALREVCLVLDGLTLSLGSECDETLREVGVDLVRTGPVDDPDFWPANWRGLVLASMKATGYCGDCLWCQVCHLHDQCSALLDAARTGE